MASMKGQLKGGNRLVIRRPVARADRVEIGGQKERLGS